MKKYYLSAVFLLLILFGCSEPNSVFFVDPFLSKVMESGSDIHTSIRNINQEHDTHIEVVPLEAGSSFVVQIQEFLEENPFTVVFLGAFPGKGIPEISDSYPETLFAVIGADFNSPEDNIVYVITDRREAFRTAGVYGRKYLDNLEGEVMSSQIGVYFIADSSMRKQELNAFLEGAGDVSLHDYSGIPEKNLLLRQIKEDLSNGIRIFLFACLDLNSYCLETVLAEEDVKILMENYNSVDYYSERIIASIEENPYSGIEGVLMIRKTGVKPKRIVVPAAVVDGDGFPLSEKKKQ
jgi:hypothetical protein